MTQAAPYLKMYSLYVQNFDEAMNTIKTWSEKSPAFNAIIQSIQKIPECNSLTLQVHSIVLLFCMLALYCFRLTTSSLMRNISALAGY